ncbi:MAG: M48 family metalloprotease [Candidatus Methylacidiphilales bacterium]
MKFTKNLVIFSALMVVLTSCGDGWKNYISTEVDAEMGKSAQNQYDAIYADQILNEKENKELYKGINLIKERILKSGNVTHADDFKWELKIINDTVLNAFCLPGGKIYVYTGLIKYLDNEAQLAGVIGHEIAHADKRHSIDNMAKELGLSALISLVFGDGSSLIHIAQNLIGLKFSRDNEAQADEYSVNYLYNTVYDASEANGFFNKLEKDAQSQEVSEFLSTHPAPENRKQVMLEHWKKLGGKKGKKFEENYKKIKSLLPENTEKPW